MFFAELPALSISFSTSLWAVGVLLVTAVVLGSCLVFATNRKIASEGRRGWLSRGLYLVFVVMVIVLAGSSFGSIVQFGHMAGYALLIHVAAAGAFVFLLLAIAALYLPRGRGANDQGSVYEHRWWVARWSVWALVVSGIAAAGTMFLSMLPVLGTDDLLQVAELHRYAGLAVVAAAVLHLYALGCTRFGLR